MSRTAYISAGASLDEPIGLDPRLEVVPHNAHQPRSRKEHVGQPRQRDHENAKELAGRNPEPGDGGERVRGEVAEYNRQQDVEQGSRQARRPEVRHPDDYPGGEHRRADAQHEDEALDGEVEYRNKAHLSTAASLPYAAHQTAGSAKSPTFAQTSPANSLIR